MTTTPTSKPVKAPNPMKPVGEVQLPDTVTAQSRLGIDLLPHRGMREKMERFLPSCSKIRVERPSISV